NGDQYFTKQNSLGIAKDLPEELVQQYVLAYVDTIESPKSSDQVNSRNLEKEIKDLYRYNNYSLLWTTLTAPNPDAKELLNALSESFEHGLNPDHYLTDSLLSRFDETYSYSQEIDILDLIKLDVRLSSAYMAYVNDLHYGHIDPSLLGEYWQLAKRKTELSPYLAGKSFKEGIKMVTPRTKAYLALQKELENYIALQELGGWSNIPDTMRVTFGSSHEAIYLLRDRLYYTGDYNKGLGYSSRELTFDKDLKKALSDFQSRHGLKPDGLLNIETIAALNIPIEDRIDQIKINLERLKWIPEYEDDRIIEVNIPDFKLTLYKKSKVVKSFKAILGKTSSPTPVLESKIEYITFSPSWFVTDVNFNRHVLPKLKKNPEYLDMLGYKLYARNDLKGEKPIDAKSVEWREIDVINSKFRALHSPNAEDNMHGKIKFGMPNKEGLFICDAANPTLFDFSFRAFNFSSISVENPELLAKYLLDDNDWSVMAIQDHMKSSKPESVTLDKGIDVNVIYLTAWVNEDGFLQFRDDVYGYDKAHAKLLRLEDDRWNQK
ncbi:MAG: L,D-transpeptidase family protein, partial [Bacteroidota bacterium]